MMKEVFLPCFIIHSRFFVPSRLSYKQLLKNTCQPYKIWCRKAYVALSIFNIREKVIRLISLHREKDQTKNFFHFLYKRPFDHRKEANSTSKGSTSNPLQAALLTRYGGKAGITLKYEILQRRI